MATGSVARDAVVDFLPVGLRMMEVLNCPSLAIKGVADPFPPWNEGSQPKTEIPRLTLRKRLGMGPVVNSLG